MIVLGLDPGQHCGWFVLKGRKRVRSGVWDVTPKTRKKDPPHRGYWYQLLVDHLDGLLGSLPKRPTCIAVEKVERHSGTYAAHEYGAIVALIQVVAWRWQIPVVFVPVEDVKRAATGKARATKEEMVEAAVERWRFQPDGDDEADAGWIAEAARVAA